MGVFGEREIPGVIRFKTVGLRLDKLFAYLSPAFGIVHCDLSTSRSALRRESAGVAATARGQHNQYRRTPRNPLQNAFGWSGEHLHRFLIHGIS